MVTSFFAVRLIAFPLPQASPHFLMFRADFRLFAALALSLLAHLLPLVPGLIPTPQPSSPTPPLQAELRPPLPAPALATPPLHLPEPASPSSPSAAKRPPPPRPQAPATAPKTWTQAVGEQLRKLDAAGQFYPAEAIARGLQGDALVLLVIDESGNVVAARIEQSSGHPILDEAALRAARTLKSLPADTPQQSILPIRFRLK